LSLARCKKQEIDITLRSKEVKERKNNGVKTKSAEILNLPGGSRNHRKLDLFLMKGIYTSIN
jgi:hypothetical protein